MEEEGVVPPAPIMVEEEGVQPPPLPIVEVEEEVVQPQPMEVLQPPTFAEQLEQMKALEEAPLAPSTVANWMAATVGNAEHHTRFISTTVDEVISHCEEARLKLQEIVAGLVEAQEPGDAAEILYTNWSGPLPGAVDVATRLVREFFFDRTAPLQAARRDLWYLVGFLIPYTRGNFNVYAMSRGQGAVHLLLVLMDQAGFQAREAMQRLNYVAFQRSYTDGAVVRVCRISRARTEAALRVSTAVTSLQQTITDVDQVLVGLRAMRLNLQTVLNLQDPPRSP